MKHVYDTLIIGGGPAGYTAAMYAARAGLDALVLERMSIGGQMTLTSDIDNYPGFEDGVDGFELGMKMHLGAERFGAKTEYAEVTAVDFAKPIKQIKTVSGDFFAKTVIIATGANPRMLNVPQESERTGRGVHYCAHCDGRFYKDKTVAVIGGGNTAVSDALYLSRLAKKVYLVHRRNALRATKIYSDALLKAPNAELVWNSTVQSLLADETFNGLVLQNVQSGEQKELLCDAVFVSIGRNPATELFKGILTLDENGYIVADESTQTNIDGVYAVGDVRTKALRQVVTAVGDGAVAVHYAEEYLSRNE